MRSLSPGATLGWLAHPVLFIGYLLCRDLLGPVSFGKRIVGLSVKTRWALRRPY